MTIEQHIEELRAELQANDDPAERKQIAVVKRCARNVERSRHPPGLSILAGGVEVGGIIALRFAGATFGEHQSSQSGDWR